MRILQYKKRSGTTMVGPHLAFEAVPFWFQPFATAQWLELYWFQTTNMSFGINSMSDIVCPSIKVPSSWWWLAQFCFGSNVLLQLNGLSYNGSKRPTWDLEQNRGLLQFAQVSKYIHPDGDFVVVRMCAYVQSKYIQTKNWVCVTS